jgi:hypothetical protein
LSINLWKLGGKPTSFNPLPVGATNSVNLLSGDYIVTFKVKSLSSAVLRVHLFDWFDFKQEFNISPTLTSYTFTFKSKVGQAFYFRDVNSIGDIIIEEIELVQKPLGTATINGLDGFGYKLDGAVDGSLKAVGNFQGKIKNSTVENPHVFKISNWTTALQSPSGAWGEPDTIEYAKIYSLNDSNIMNGYGTNNYNQISQHLFSFNVITEFEKKIRKIPVEGTAAKVQWLKDNVSTLRANWHGYGTNVQANNVGKADFVGKVAGSTVENPHSTRYKGSASTLQSPVDFSGDMIQLGYNQMTQLGDGLIASLSTTTNNTFSQQLFSFDLIEYVKRKYGVDVPGATTADKVAWLKANVSSLRCNWHGYGSSVGGNKATISYWANGWSVNSTGAVHTNATVTSIRAIIGGSISALVDTNGFVHFLAHTDPSDGVTPSVINTDFVELEVTLNAGENKASFTTWLTDTNAWNTAYTQSHANATVSKLNFTDSTMNNSIDTNGYVHFIAYAEPSNGISSSIIYTDYIDLEIEAKQSAVVNSKWTLNPNVKLIDDETLELDATGTYQHSTCIFTIEPNKTYMFTQDFNSPVNIDFLESNGNYISTTSWFFGNKTFTSPSNARQLKVFFSSGANATGKFTFKRPSLNLGSTPVSYEKKRGERMVKPVVKKNLFNKNQDIVEGYYLSSTGSETPNIAPNKQFISGFISVKPNTNYIVSRKDAYEYMRVGFYTLGKTFLSRTLSNINVLSHSFTTPSDCYFLRVSNEFTDLDSTMLQQGTESTPFTPYEVQINSKPKKLVPKKNLVSNDVSAWEQGGVTGTGGNTFTANKQVASNRIRYINAVYVKPNTTYTVKLANDFITGIQQYSIGDTLLSDSGWLTDPSKVYTFVTRSDTYIIHFAVKRVSEGNITPSDISNVLFQLEEGSTPTAYEPYTEVIPRAKSGLSFNGVTDYLQLPSMTMDSIEIDLYVDNVQYGLTWKWILDARDGLSNHWAYLTTTNLAFGVEGFTPSGSFVKGERTKVKLSKNTPFTDDLTLFANKSGAEKLKGILYGIKCYLNGAIVAEYDFTNPETIVGTTLLPDKYTVPKKNLLPKLTSGLWSNSGNKYTVYSDNIVAGNFTAGTQNHFSVFADVVAGKTYTASGVLDTSKSRLRVGKGSDSSIIGGTVGDGLPYMTFTVPAGETRVVFQVDNNYNGSLIGGEMIFADLQLEEGSVVTKYEPYTPLVKEGAVNLIPDFEDKAWSFHSNFKVLGKDYARLDATGVYQLSRITLGIDPNKTYLFGCGLGVGSRVDYTLFDENNNVVKSLTILRYNASSSNVFIPVPLVTNAKTIEFQIKNTSETTGTFDFIKPQLYQLDGKEGTITGSPVPQLKRSKRVLYAKR